MKLNKKTVLFYSSVKTKKMFSIQEYYKTDILILKKLGFRVKLSNSFLDFFKFWDYDISFIYFFRYGFFPAFISRFFFKKVLFTGGIDNLNRETTSMVLYRIQQFFFILCYFVANKVIFVSKSDKKNVAKFFPINLIKKHFLSWHVIDFESYSYSSDYVKGKIIITIAWMLKVQNITRKGVDKAVQSYAELIKLDPEFHMLIIGPIGRESSYLFNLIQSLGLENKITVTGALPLKDKISWLKKSSIYLQLSEYEGFGISAIEALASGNIVIHSNNGGLAEGVGKYGIVLNDCNDFKQIAKIIVDNYNSKTKDNTILDGINYVENNFQFSRRLSDFKLVFSTLLLN